MAIFGSPPTHPFAVLRLSLPPGEVWSDRDALAWAGFSSRGALLAHGQCSLADLPLAVELELLLPACRVSMHLIDLPERVGKYRDALIQQILEDRLLGEREDALVVSGDNQAVQQRLWVCSRRWIQAGLQRLIAAGRYPARVIPEYALLPEAAEGTVWAEATGGTIFRNAKGRYGIVGNAGELAALVGEETLLQVDKLADRPCSPCARMRLPVALRQMLGWRMDLEPLRRSGALFALSALLAFVGMVAHWRHLESRFSGLQHEMNQTFVAAYPGTPIVDPLLQWESKRRGALQAQHDALDTAVDFAARLNASLRPQSMEVREGEVRLTLSQGEADQYKTQLDGLGAPEYRPAGPGFTQLSYRVGRNKR